jgi:hypothetical protein
VRFVIRLTVASSLVALLIGAAIPAEAKGPSSASIAGPGIASPIRIGWEGGENRAFAALIRDSGIFTGLWCRACEDRLRTPAAGELGPRYTVTYAMDLEGVHGASGMVVQDVYPFAEPDPVTFVAPHQPFWGTSETVGGWYLARPRLRRELVRLGVPDDAVATSSPSGAVRDATATPVGASPLGSVVVIAIAVAAVLVGWLVVVRRTRRRRPSHPSPAH